MKKGQKVKVYQKPLSKEDFEGEATLLRKMESNRDDDVLQNWEVRFESDGFICERLINIE